MISGVLCSIKVLRDDVGVLFAAHQCMSRRRNETRGLEYKLTDRPRLQVTYTTTRISNVRVYFRVLYI